MLKIVKSMFCMLMLSLSMGSAVFACDTGVGSNIDAISPTIEPAGECRDGTASNKC